ncbi:MAG: hypothetical protein D5R97_04475 [Candidatus Syntrophonatronum acetioxidans]|uniref:DUF21 domain-containing protein n=1 Tax=Candidatus Syntrophonatronum acetioxidans TaxID=1795816 RepID=A0A424YF92_9FIRM|nr:MAG: hypothetical protein D5R97_04475 [Candidatus Syntrophonatronum acetioxidans]
MTSKKNNGAKYKWVAFVSLWTFILSVVITIASEVLLENIKSFILSVILLLIIIVIGVIFDTIGIAAAAAEEVPFHAKAAKKVRGARQAIFLIRNADQVANFCNDVVGDISGIVSGVIGAAIVFRFVAEEPAVDRAVLSVVMTGIIASLTVGGKAVGKMIALEKANSIIYLVSVVMTRFDRLLPGIFPVSNKINKKRK